MILKRITEILEATIVVDSGNLHANIKGACSADLMSAVLYYFTPDSLLITGLNQTQVIRTAEIAGIKSVVFVQNKKPDKETVELAKEKKIPLLITSLCMYAASGKLFQAGLQGCPKK